MANDSMRKENQSKTLLILIHFLEKMSFAETGEHRLDVHDNLLITHGTSLLLMAMVFDCIQDSDLHDINPTKDWKQCKKRRLHHYYVTATIEEVECASCIRLLYDADRCIIEYLYTVPECRSHGLGRKLVEFCRVLAGSRAFCVISTEDACAYWLGLGFIWDESKDTKALNEFDDTYLLCEGA